METGSRLKASSDRLVKLGTGTATPGLQGKRFIHYTTVAPYRFWLRYEMMLITLWRLWQNVGFFSPKHDDKINLTSYDK